MRRFEALGYGPVRFGGGVETTWWSGFEQTVVHASKRPPIGTVPPGVIEGDIERRPDADVVYSSHITRPMCACKVLGQGCSTPQEGAPAGRPGAPEGPSTLAVVGGIGAVGILGLLAAGVL